MPRQRGGSLIEVMVSVLVLSIGLLGIGAAQMAALRNSQSSYGRAQAAALTGALFDAMRANLAESRNGGYTLGRSCSALATGTTQAQTDLANWAAAVRAQLGAADTTCMTVTCNGATCTVTLQWDDSRSSGGSNAQTLTTVSRL